jgi:1-phosphofructokinase family hexose kinase
MTTDSITTICLNPALDVSYHVGKLIPEQKSRSDTARHDPGGNGINIARAFKRMQIESHTFCVIAGSVGQILKDLLDKQLNNIYYEHVDGNTRINATIIELETRQQFQIVDSGTDIPTQQLKQITDDFVKQADNGFAIITGSTQPNVPKDLYAKLIERINDQGGKAVIDSHGEVLKHAIAAKPFLIKPNKYELETLLQVELPTVEAIAHTARQLQQGGVTNVCVSLGEGGALLTSPDNSYYAPALNVAINTTVGAGDSMVAGMVAGFQLENTAEAALRYGIACGAGTVMHPGTELFSGNELESFRQRVEIETLDI